MKTLQAVAFDFDGVVADTETLDLQVWQEEFQLHGVELDLGEWLKGIGAGPGTWSIYDLLDRTLGRQADRELAKTRTTARLHDLTRNLQPCPGVVEWLDFLQESSIPYAIASSSDREWVHGHLATLGLTGRFPLVITREDAPRAKPFPDLYQEACRRMGVETTTTVAFEDSANGLTAARSAGLYAVAVPGPVTSSMDLSHAHMRARSLSEVSWEGLQEGFAQAG